jgi:hypothetical protein
MARLRLRKPDDAWTRTLIALVVLLFSFFCIATISALAIALSNNAAETSELVFTSVLPILGTWVGTVLAFYFARENLEAATSSTLALTGRDRATPVTQVMIREADITAFDLAGRDPSSVKLSEVRARMRDVDPPSRRLPIRNAQRAVLYVIHDSTLAAFAESQSKTLEQIADMTIGDLVKNADMRQLIEAIGFVSETADIAEARRVMSSIDKCNDVFVTPGGNKEERAIGWLTNTLLAGVQ